MAASKQAPTVVDKFKMYESELSTVFGFVVVVVIGVALLFFLRRATLNQSPKLSDLGAETSAEDLMKDQSKNTPKPGEYVVKPGDHLWKIAQDQMGDGYQWMAIARANNLKSPYVVREGQTLTIPSPDPKIAEKMSPTPEKMTAKPVESKTTDAKMVSPTSGEYVVKAGDNLWKIAVAEYNDGYKWLEIYRANKSVIGRNPGIIRAGQKLVMPSGK